MNFDFDLAKKKTKKWISENLIIIFFTVGIFFIVIGSLAKWVWLGVDWSDLLVKGGGALLGGGVFAAIMKSTQFVSIFQKSITEVFYDPVKIKNRPVIDERWKVMTNSLLRGVLPQSYSEASEIIHKQFFNSELHCHFERYRACYEITVDSETNVAKVVHSVSSDLVITKDKEITKPILKQTISARSGPVTMEHLRLNAVELKVEDHLTLYEEKKVEITIDLSPYRSMKGAIPFEKVAYSEQKLEEEPFISTNISRYIKGLTTVEVKINEGYSVVFLKSGLGKLPDDCYSKCAKRGVETWSLAKSEDLLLPGQGYTIIIVPEQKGTD